MVIEGFSHVSITMLNSTDASHKVAPRARLCRMLFSKVDEVVEEIPLAL